MLCKEGRVWRISGGYRYAAREVAVQYTLAWGLTGDRERDQGMHEDVKK